MTIDFEKVTRKEIIGVGQRVQVTLDQHGKVIAASSPFGPGPHSITKLAIAHAIEQVARQAKAKSDTERIAESTRIKRLRAEERFARVSEWLEAAHQAHPDFKEERLAQRARQIHLLNRPEAPAEERDEITEYYAGLFLERKCNPPAT